MSANRPVCSTLSLTIRTARTPAEIEDAAALYVRSGSAAFTWRPEGHFRLEDFRLFAQDEEVWLTLMGEALVGTAAIALFLSPAR